ncbi:hypothetical protein [Halosegnis sp.]|uniref:hypothetical protein n=1 Tax=Halosegnis sp. TaxID=2864959 RepID=UPI0035D46926
MSDDLETTLADAFQDHGADEETAAAAAARVAALREDHDEELTAAKFLDLFADADAYETFEHRFDLAVGDLAAATEGCTDSRAYRLSGFDELAADPEQGG